MIQHASIEFPRVVMTLLVRNEADLIADNLLFHWRLGINQFIVMDNGSIDGTQEIVEEMSRHIPIELLHQPADNYAQSDWVTAMARRAKGNYQADWVINNDADEFWVFPTGGAPAYLRDLDPEVVKVFVQRHNAVLTERTDPLRGLSSHPASTELFERLSLNSLGKPLPPKCLHRGSTQVTVLQGNHNVEDLPGKCHHTSREETASTRDPYILHYPYRNFTHYKRKIDLGGAAYSRNNSLPINVGLTWRKHHQLLTEQGLDSFWLEQHRSHSEVIIAEIKGSIWRERSVPEMIQQERSNWQEQMLARALARFVACTQEIVEQRMRFVLAKIEEQNIKVTHSLAHNNFSHVISGLQQHCQAAQRFADGIHPQSICECFAKLRDIASLYPENPHFFAFLRRVLEIKQADDTRKLRQDLEGKQILLHFSCMARVPLAKRARQSFVEVDSSIQSLIVIGDPTLGSPECSQLNFRYHQGVLHVPVSDHYEHLASKLFYTLMILQLLVAPTQLVKLDDDLHLDDKAMFVSYLTELQDQQTAYAGWQVALPHHQQWHGWHVGKCNDLMLNQRGYQYPMPKQYAAGGFGYVLGQKGLEACSSMFMGMRSFFEQSSVQLEDAFVGIAIEQRGLSLKACNHKRKPPLAVNEAALPGLKRVGGVPL
jgi:hypothetical protein